MLQAVQDALEAAEVLRRDHAECVKAVKIVLDGRLDLDLPLKACRNSLVPLFVKELGFYFLTVTSCNPVLVLAGHLGKRLVRQRLQDPITPSSSMPSNINRP